MDLRTYEIMPVRDAAILTTSYVVGNIIGSYQGADTRIVGGVALKNQLILYVDFTKGSLTTAEILVEFNNDLTDANGWYQETLDVAGTPSGGSVTMGENLMTRQLSATGKYRISIPIKDQFIRVSVKGTGTVTSSSMKV